MVSLKYVHSKTPSFNSTLHTLFFFFYLLSLSINTWPFLSFWYIFIWITVPKLHSYIYPILFSEIHMYIFDEWVTLVGEAGHVQFIVVVVVHAWDDMKFARAPLLQHGFLPPILHKNHLQVKTRIMNLLNSFSFLCILTPIHIWSFFFSFGERRRYDEKDIITNCRSFHLSLSLSLSSKFQRIVSKKNSKLQMANFCKKLWIKIRLVSNFSNTKIQMDRIMHGARAGP